ncbi:MAG: hypothetical protein GC155_14330 [Alphaproteobacteria bacterium]|nr:hypothetical protein [Alphaproteobacteria bacterium]
MRQRFLMLVLATGLAASCVAVGKDNPQPGGVVWTEDKAISWMPANLGGGKAGTKGWAYVQVFAPPSASECWVDSSIFSASASNPHPRGTPDQSGAVLLTVRNEQRSSSFSCRTPSGVQTRVVQSEQVVRTRTSPYRKPSVSKYWLVPPLAHINPNDPQGAAHWDAFNRTLCQSDPTIVYSLCKEDRLEHMKARDLSG